MKNRLIPFTIFTSLSIIIGYITGNNIYYIFFTALLCVALLSIVSLLISYLEVSYLQKVTPKEGIKGETVALEMQIYNDFFIPLSYVEVEYNLPDEKLNMYSSIAKFGVPQKGKVSINQDVFCKYRGKWQIGIRRVKIYDIFGLFHITLDFYNSPNYRVLTLNIKPRIVMLDYLPLPFKENIGSQNQIQKNTTDMAEISDIRKYRQGDILKKIHWKLSSAKQELMVKNHSFSMDPDTFIYIDCSSHGLSGIESIELEDMIVECATAVANYLLEAKLHMKFIIMGKERIELSGASTEDFFSIYESISTLTFDYDFSFFDLFSNELSATANVNSIFIITHTISSKGFDSLIYLREASINITVLLMEQAKRIHDKKTHTMIDELIAVGVTIVFLSPGDDLNLQIKEQTNEK